VNGSEIGLLKLWREEKKTVNRRERGRERAIDIWGAGGEIGMSQGWTRLTSMQSKSLLQIADRRSATEKVAREEGCSRCSGAGEPRWKDELGQPRRMQW
jgi:hypothetical protein